MEGVRGLPKLMFRRLQSSVRIFKPITIHAHSLRKQDTVRSDAGCRNPICENL